MSQKHTLRGRIFRIYDTQSVGANNFRKREFIRTVPDGKDGKYDQQVKMELTKDRCDTLDHFREGQPATVEFEVRGNEYNGKFYVNLHSLSVVKEGTSDTAYQHGSDQFTRPPQRPAERKPEARHEYRRGGEREEEPGIDF